MPAPVVPPASAGPPVSAPGTTGSPVTFVGIDFGTTNSVVSLADADPATPARVARHGPAQDEASFRSLLCLWPDDDGPPGTVRAAAGPAAVEAFRTHGADARLIQSVKSFTASRSFESTVMFGQRFTLVDLIVLVLRDLRRSSERSLGPLGEAAWCGRPVRFVGAQADETLALTRLEQAYRRVGFSALTFIPEPQAAAHHYARGVTGRQTCLVADFGGGTSDFTLLRVEGAASPAAAPRIDVLAQSGVGIAGDAFDRRIVDHVVSPLLGLGSTYRGMSGQALDVPAHYYESLSSWHRLSMMRTRQTLHALQDIRLTAADPAAIERFMYLLENELAFDLHAAVTETKARLSQADDATFVFRSGPIDVRMTVSRADFEAWIAPELGVLGDCVDTLCAEAGLAPTAIDRVFLTGGSSLIPAVRRLFAERFGASRLSGGDEFFSIAAGLALAAREAADDGPPAADAPLPALG